MARQTASRLLAAALRSPCLSLAKTCSIGFRSGEYFGNKQELGTAPADRSPHGFAAVTAEIVHADDVIATQRWRQHLIDA